MAISHEAVEFFLIFRPAQVIHVIIELLTHAIKLLALFFQAGQLSFTVVIKSSITAAGSSLHIVHRIFEITTIPLALSFTLPAIKVVAPQDVGKHSKARGQKTTKPRTISAILRGFQEGFIAFTFIKNTPFSNQQT